MTPAVAAAATTRPLMRDPAGTAHCDGHDVLITRDHFETVIEGACGRVVVSASHGAVNVARAREIRVEGSDVTVLNEAVGALVVVGARNTCNMTEVASADLSGDGNGVLARHVGSAHLRGNDNYINADKVDHVEDTGRGNRT